jgi:uncharacterized protein YqeY
MTTTTTVAEKVTADLTAAMKAKDTAKTSALRMAKAALMNREIDKKSPLDDQETLAVLRTLVKQREDSIFQFRKANRPELVEKEEAELAVLRAYLPAEATDAEVDAAVQRAMTETGASSAKDIGKAMKAAMAALAETGKPVDGKRVNDAVRKRLGA